MFGTEEALQNGLISAVFEHQDGALGKVIRPPRVSDPTSLVHDSHLGTQNSRRVGNGEDYCVKITNCHIGNKVCRFPCTPFHCGANYQSLSLVSLRHILNHARDHSVDDGLAYVAAWNAFMTNTKVRLTPSPDIMLPH